MLKKQLAKKISVFLLAFACLFLAIGQDAAKIFADASVPSFDEYLADYYNENSSMKYWIGEYQPPYRTFVENGKANGLAADCIAWRTANFSLADVASYSRKEVGYHQTILFDLLYEGGVRKFPMRITRRPRAL